MKKKDILASFAVSDIPCLTILCLMRIGLAEERVDVLTFLLASNHSKNSNILHIDVLQKAVVIVVVILVIAVVSDIDITIYGVLTCTCMR